MPAISYRGLFGAVPYAYRPRGLLDPTGDDGEERERRTGLLSDAQDDLTSLPGATTRVEDAGPRGKSGGALAQDVFDRGGFSPPTVSASVLRPVTGRPGAALTAVTARDALRSAASSREPMPNAPPSRRQCVLEGGGCSFRVQPNPKADGDAPFHEVSWFSRVKDMSKEIEEAAQEYGVDPNLIRAIMYMETTHGYYDEPLSWFDWNKSVLPMNINTDAWGETLGTRSELKNARNNIRAGARMLKGIMANFDRPPSIEEIATLYNNLNASRVGDYGARVRRIYDEQSWN